MTPAPSPNINVNAYEGPPTGARYEKWREEVCRNFCRVDIEPSQDGQIDCRFQIALISTVSLFASSGTSAKYLRTRQVLADGCNDFALVSSTAGPLRGVHAGRDVDMLGSEMCLVDLGELSAVATAESGQFTTMRIPRHALLAICPDAENRISKPTGADPALRSMISRYTALARDSAPHLDADGRHLRGQHLIDLVGLLIGTKPDEAALARRRGHSQARLALIKSDVLKGLGRADLTIGSVAHRYGLSSRQAQRLFEQVGSTFTEFVLEQRLLLARRLLLDPRNSWRKVSDIAHSSGFSDLSYFNRVFRRRFGVPPSEIRNA